jgi:hypothetical protein
LPHPADGLQRRRPTLADQQFLVEVGVAAMQRQVALQEVGQRVTQRQLVADRQLDVDALDPVAILAHAWQRNHHILVQLEGVGVARDGGGARAIQPEFPARLGVDSDEAFGTAQVAHAHHLRGGVHHRRLVGSDDIADQDHFRPSGGFRPALGLVA